MSADEEKANNKCDDCPRTEAREYEAFVGRGLEGFQTRSVVELQPSGVAELDAVQEACAFVDVSDSLDPLSLAAAGVELPRLLWIRCGES